MKLMARVGLVSGILAAFWTLFLSGCGSGNRSEATSAVSTRGQAACTVVWPTSSRLVPFASNSVRVQFFQEGSVIAERLLVRPTGGGPVSAVVENLPVDTLTVRAAAYPQTDGTGTALATGTTSVVIRAGEITPFTLTMESTITRLEITPDAPALSVGATAQLTMTARDATDAIVLTTPAKIEWSSSGPAVSVDESGTIKAVSGGTATITVKEHESGVTASVSVSVTRSGQTYIIRGVPYVTADPQETLTAAFTPSEGGATTRSYKSFVLLQVSGVGQAYANQYNDAFYVYTGPFSDNPANGHDGGFYQLAFGTSPLPEFSLANNAKNFLVDPVPPYNPAHTYTVILDTGLSEPGILHFGVTDGGYSDNTGEYTITVTQLIPAP